MNRPPVYTEEHELKQFEACETEYARSSSSSVSLELSVHHRHQYVSVKTSGGDGIFSSRPRFRLLNPQLLTAAPLIIFFHGAGDTCIQSWMSVTRSVLEAGYRVLMYDRSRPHGNELKPHQAVSELLAYLHQTPDVSRGPYVLVAHGSGGCVARLFLHQRPRDVAGMVLAEMGPDSGLAASVDRDQFRKQVLGHRPLSVVRGNALRSHWNRLAHEAAKASTQQEIRRVDERRAQLEAADAHDRLVKRAQLTLSKHSRFVQLDDVGHHVVRERPDEVAAEVCWVLEQLGYPRIVDTGDVLPPRPSTAGGLKRGFSLRRKPSVAAVAGASAGRLGGGGGGGGGGLKRGLSQRIKDWAGGR